METNMNNEMESPELKLKRLTKELDGRTKSESELRNYIDILHTGWSSDKTKLMEATEELNKIAKCSTAESRKKGQGDEIKLNKLLNELISKKQTIRRLSKIIGVIETAWSIDKEKLLKATEKLNMVEKCSTEHKQPGSDNKLKCLQHELNGERKTIIELRNFIDVMKEGWKSDKTKLLKATEKLKSEEAYLVKDGITQTEKEKFVQNNSSFRTNNLIISPVPKKVICLQDENLNDETRDLIAHGSMRNAEQNLILCPLCCNKSFSSQQDLKSHLLNIIEKVFCPICSTRYDNIMSLVNHLENGCNSNATCNTDVYIVPDVIKPGEKVNIKNELQILYPVVEINDTKECEEMHVEEIGGSESESSYHGTDSEEQEDEVSVKNKDSPYACSNCPTFFRTTADARDHLPLHFPGSKAVKCYLCYCFFHDNIVLKKHMKDKHNIDILPQSDSMTSSGDSTHSQCDVIEGHNILEKTKQINEKHSSETDDITPAGETKDEKLDNKSPPRSNRKRKIKSKEESNTAYPFTCYCCSTSFKTVTELQSHINQHSSTSKAIQCYLCHCIFPNDTIFKTHLRDDHDTDLCQSVIMVERLDEKVKDTVNPLNTSTSSSGHSVSKHKKISKLESKGEKYVQGWKDSMKKTPLRTNRGKKRNSYFDDFIVY